MSEFFKALEGTIKQHGETIESISGGKVGGKVIFNAKTKEGNKWRLETTEKNFYRINKVL